MRGIEAAQRIFLAARKRGAIRTNLIEKPVDKLHSGRREGDGRQIVVNGQVYGSIRLAAKKCKCTTYRIGQWLKVGIAEYV